ncbi:MAG: RagB/SusD family nutrient uptake outer membrane protein [Bacteroidota bacterium]|nr:RagB/SusD family nutrient uptake outer membrane protein [Bacteroidota bacterium]
MKNKIYLIVIAFVVLIATSCEKKFLDLDPQDTITEASYFTNAAQFKAFTNEFYTQPIGFKSYNGASWYDWRWNRMTAQTVGTSDIYWRNPWMYIRVNNYAIQKGNEYAGKRSDIQQYIAASYFFRAWNYYFLLKRFGGVPVVTNVLDVDNLNFPRNSRYEVVKQILADLDTAIAGLPLEANISSTDKGHVSQQAAKAFKARVLLYEATWEKYVKTTTDGDGVAIGAGTAGYDASGAKITSYLTEAASLAKSVMTDPAYELWNKVDSLSYYYLFVLEDSKSNPKGFDKSSNKEYIFSCRYDYTLLNPAINISHTGAGLPVDRAWMDLYNCKDGLDYKHSKYYKGYNKMTDEFDNRDYRLYSLVKRPGNKYWGYGAGTNGGGADYTKANYIYGLNNWPTTYNYTYYPDLTTGGGGYSHRKWITENPGREDYKEAYDYALIRLPEMYLIYAEAQCELGNGTISDADLDISINKIRARCGVAKLTNALIQPYSDLTMLGEIRRERLLELGGEDLGVDDIKRWGIAEAESNKPSLGWVVKNADGTATEVTTFVNNSGKKIYDATKYPYGIDATTGSLILSPAVTTFTRTNYLNPIPTDELSKQPKLLQNPGWK